jgi:hypothetical protein
VKPDVERHTIKFSITKLHELRGVMMVLPSVLEGKGGVAAVALTGIPGSANDHPHKRSQGDGTQGP